MIDTDLRQIEKSTYRSAADSGLWDLLLASIVAMLAIAPKLSVHLGDFLSSAVFLPVFVAVWIVIRVVQNRVVAPRIGIVEFAQPRRQRLVLLSVVMLVVNVVALVMGLFAATRTPVFEGPIVSFAMSMTILVGFSLASFLLEIPRVFFYGLLLAVAPIVGEALFIRGYASHHGFPIVFGVSSCVILVSGIVRFVRFLPRPQGANEQPIVEGADD